MIRLTIIANGHRLVRDLTPEQTLHAANGVRLSCSPKAGTASLTSSAIAPL
jgi:hypothetical protein